MFIEKWTIKLFIFSSEDILLKLFKSTLPSGWQFPKVIHPIINLLKEYSPDDNEVSKGIHQEYHAMFQDNTKIQPLFYQWFKDQSGDNAWGMLSVQFVKKCLPNGTSLITRKTDT